MRPAFIIAARRTAVMPQGRAFAGLGVHELAAPVMLACLADAGLDVGDVDEVILSNALGAGGNPARLAALAADLPERVAGLTIDRQCAGGLDAVGLAAALVGSGQARVVLAGGAENYSRRPLRLTQAPGRVAVPYDRPPFTPWPDRDPDLTEAAAALADRLGLTRTAQDAFAVASHAHALAARDRLTAEIVPLAGAAFDGFTRPLTLATAARAKILADSVTVATTAIAADGAAFVLVVAPEIAARAARRLRIAACVTLGADPAEPGLSPVPAIAAALARVGVEADTLERVEIMEAYAAQAMACIMGAGLDPGLVNLSGGALARGHPIGASGAVLAVRLFHDLSGGAGLAAIAAAGGIGTALVLTG